MEIIEYDEKYRQAFIEFNTEWIKEYFGVLEAAIHIYKKFGFREIKLDDYGYARGDIAFEYIVDK